MCADKDVSLAQLAPAGHYIALHIGFAFPMVEKNDLPAAWVEYYTRNGLMVHDPVIRWVYANTGAIRLSAVPGPDPRRVMDDCSRFGLRFGVAISCTDGGAEGFRSFGAFMRGDREYRDDEIETLEGRLWKLHASRQLPPRMTGAELEALRLVRDGFLAKEIAGRLGVTEGAVKQRLRNARSKLGAKTGSQAVSKAIGFGLI